MLFRIYQFLLCSFRQLSRCRFSQTASVSARSPRCSLSLVFYGAWDVRSLALLGTSILANYTIGRALQPAVERQDETRADYLLFAGVGFNLIVVLGYFKYAHFLVANLNATAGTTFKLNAIILPLGISFFTFEQIGYLADIRRGHLYHHARPSPAPMRCSSRSFPVSSPDRSSDTAKSCRN